MGNIRKTFLFTMIGALIISAIAGIFILLSGNFGSLETRILLTTLSVAGYSIAGMICAALHETNKGILAKSGIVITIIAFLFYMWVIWYDHSHRYHFTLEFLITLFFLTASFAHACLMCMIKNTNKIVRIAVMATLIFIVILTSMILMMVWDNLWILRSLTREDFFLRLMGVVAICTALGTICSPILSKITKQN